MNRWLFALALIVLLFFPAAASAGDTSIGLKVGYFYPEAESGVMDAYSDYFRLDTDRLNGVMIGGELTFQISRKVDFVSGLDWYSESANVNDPIFVFTDGSPIRNEIDLEIISLTGTFRLHPFGRDHAVSPYLGVGLGVYFFDLRMDGDFVFFDAFTGDAMIRSALFQDDGAEAGVNVVAGVLFSLSPSWSISAEAEWVKVADGELEGSFFEVAALDPGLGELDLDGFNASVGISFNF